MPTLSTADAVLARAIDRLATLHGGTTDETNVLQILRADLGSARASLANTRARILALEQENQQLRMMPPEGAAERLLRFGAMFEHALDAILIADDNARYIDANPAACALLGYGREELLQRGVVDVTPDGQRELVPQLWREFLVQGKMSGEFLVQPRAGEAITVEFRAVANVLPGQHLSILRDVSRLRLAQKQLQVRQSVQRSEVVTGLYRALDTLLAARLDAQARRGWRATFTAGRSETLDRDIEQAMVKLREAIHSLEQAGGSTGEVLPEAVSR